jgi:hypothetical protein
LISSVHWSWCCTVGYNTTTGYCSAGRLSSSLHSDDLSREIPYVSRQGCRMGAGPEPGGVARAAFSPNGHSRSRGTRRHTRIRGRHTKTPSTRRVGRVPARDAPGSTWVAGGITSTPSGVCASREAHQSLLSGRPLKLRLSQRRLARRFEALRWLVQRPDRLLHVRLLRTMPRADCAR